MPTYTKDQLGSSEKLIERDLASRKIKSIVFPHKMKVGINHDEFKSDLEVHGSIFTSGSIRMGETTSPLKPSDGFGGVFFVKSDGKPYFVSHEIAETNLLDISENIIINLTGSKSPSGNSLLKNQANDLGIGDDDPGDNCIVFMNGTDSLYTFDNFVFKATSPDESKLGMGTNAPEAMFHMRGKENADPKIILDTGTNDSTTTAPQIAMKGSVVDHPASDGFYLTYYQEPGSEANPNYNFGAQYNVGNVAAFHRFQVNGTDKFRVSNTDCAVSGSLIVRGTIKTKDAIKFRMGDGDSFPDVWSIVPFGAGNVPQDGLKFPGGVQIEGDLLIVGEIKEDLQVEGELHVEGDLLTVGQTDGTIKAGANSTLALESTFVQAKVGAGIDYGYFRVLDDTNSEMLKVQEPGHVIKPYTCAFLATKTSDQSDLAIDDWVVATFTNEVFDNNNNYNASSSVFTAPVTGKYILTTCLYIKALDTDANSYVVDFTTSNRSYRIVALHPKFSQDLNFYTFSGSAIVDMDQDDIAKVSVYQTGGTSQTDIFSNASHAYTYFSGYLLG